MSISAKLFDLTKNGYTVCFRRNPCFPSSMEIYLRKDDKLLTYILSEDDYRQSRMDNDTHLLIDLEHCADKIQAVCK